MTTTNYSNWKNVNNWHWVEKDYTSSAKDFISAIHLKDEFAQSIIKASLDGEFIANVRKGKIIVIYDYKLSVDVKNETGESHFELDIDSAVDDSLMRGMPPNEASKFLPILTKVTSALSKFIEDKARNELLGGSLDGNLQSQKTKLDLNSSNADSPSFKSSFSSRWSFNCPSVVLQDCLVGNLFPVWSHSTADGNLFTVHGGLLTYKVLSKSNSEIELFWKLRPWSDDSRVKITFTDDNGRTTLHVNQSQVESEFVSNAEENWENYFWTPISISTGIGYDKHDNNA